LPSGRGFTRELSSLSVFQRGIRIRRESMYYLQETKKQRC
jgi:hypothetical protein